MKPIFHKESWNNSTDASCSLIRLAAFWLFLCVSVPAPDKDKIDFEYVNLGSIFEIKKTFVFYIEIGNM